MSICEVVVTHFPTFNRSICKGVVVFWREADREEEVRGSVLHSEPRVQLQCDVWCAMGEDPGVPAQRHCHGPWQSWSQRGHRQNHAGWVFPLLPCFTSHSLSNLTPYSQSPLPLTCNFLYLISQFSSSAAPFIIMVSLLTKNFLNSTSPFPNTISCLTLKLFFPHLSL